MDIQDSIKKYQEITNFLERNKDKYVEEYLKFVLIFKCAGKQGIVGVLKMIDDTTALSYAVFKLSQDVNYLSEHEYSIMQELNTLMSFCPHFCKSYGLINFPLALDYKTSLNPISCSKDKVLETNVLLMEHIPKSKKFFSLIRDPKISNEVLYSILKQTLMAIAIAQRKKKFTHYDLHSSNILIKECDKDDVFLYVLDEENQFFVPTYGYYPVIIDFGFSYIEKENNYCYQSMGHTDIGFTSSHYDPITDSKLFLVSFLDEFISYRGRNEITKPFSNFVENLYSDLSIDWDCGWDNADSESVLDTIIKDIEIERLLSSTFHSDIFYCLNLFSSLINLPFKNTTNKQNITKVCQMIDSEFYKIERLTKDNPEIKKMDIKIHDLLLSFMMKIVEAVRKYKLEYYNKESRNQALEDFTVNIKREYSKITNSDLTIDIKYEKILCGIITLSEILESKYYTLIRKVRERKIAEYNKLPVKKIEQVFAILQVNFSCSYSFNNNTRVHLFDICEEKSDTFNVSDFDTLHLNTLDEIMIGSELYCKKETIKDPHIEKDVEWNEIPVFETKKEEPLPQKKRKTKIDLLNLVDLNA